MHATNDAAHCSRSLPVSATEKLWARRIGRVGLGARGVVYTLIGIFAFQAAATADAFKAQGFDGALLKLSQQPFGQFMLGIVAVGLIVFGIYSVMNARCAPPALATRSNFFATTLS